MQLQTIYARAASVRATALAAVVGLLLPLTASGQGVSAVARDSATLRSVMSAVAEAIGEETHSHRLVVSTIVRCGVANCEEAKAAVGRTLFDFARKVGGTVSGGPIAADEQRVRVAVPWISGDSASVAVTFVMPPKGKLVVLAEYDYQLEKRGGVWIVVGKQLSRIT